MSGLPSTTRSLPQLGAVHLALVEDSFGWTVATCAPVTVRPSPRVYEIHDAKDWMELVARYPMDVSNSRRHDWWRCAGAEGRLLIPDYDRTGQDCDAIHLTVRGYLTTAGAALPVDAGTTVLAGWNPDETWWLNDCLAVREPAVTWTRAEHAELHAWSLSNDGQR